MAQKLVLFAALLAAPVLGKLRYEHCQDGQCIGSPEGCLDDDTCLVAVHYAKEGDQFRFDLFADHTAEGVDKKYVAVGLSFDAEMGNDAVVACYFDDDGNTHVENYWNVDSPKNSLKVADATGGLSDGELFIEEVDGSQFLECTFLRDAVTTIETPVEPSETVVIDLTQTPFHLQGSAGAHDGQGILSKHTAGAQSAAPIDFSQLP